MDIELVLAEDLETRVHEGADSVVVVVKMSAERWRNRLESVLKNTTRGCGTASGMCCADVINLLDERINTTKKSMETLLHAGSDCVLELNSDKIRRVS